MIKKAGLSEKNQAHESENNARAGVLMPSSRRGAKIHCRMLAMTLTLCSVGLAVASQDTADSSDKPASKAVLIAEPSITFEYLISGEKLDAEKYDGANVRANLKTALRNSMGPAKLTIVECDKLQATDSKKLCADIDLLVAKLASGRDHKDTTELLVRLREVKSDLFLMAVSLRVKVGPGGSWDPNTGLITTSASTSYFRATLIEVSTGKAVWKNEVLFRNLPKIKKRKYEKALQSLLLDFPRKKEKRP